MSKTTTKKPTPKKPKPATVTDAREVPIRVGTQVSCLLGGSFPGRIGKVTELVKMDYATVVRVVVEGRGKRDAWPNTLAVLARAPRKGGK